MRLFWRYITSLLASVRWRKSQDNTNQVPGPNCLRLEGKQPPPSKNLLVIIIDIIRKINNCCSRRRYSRSTKHTRPWQRTWFQTENRNGMPISRTTLKNTWESGWIFNDFQSTFYYTLDEDVPPKMYSSFLLEGTSHYRCMEQFTTEAESETMHSTKGHELDNLCSRGRQRLSVFMWSTIATRLAANQLRLLLEQTTISAAQRIMESDWRHF